jgi:hypothetical protein
LTNQLPLASPENVGAFAPTGSVIEINILQLGLDNKGKRLSFMTMVLVFHIPILGWLIQITKVSTIQTPIIIAVCSIIK